MGILEKAQQNIELFRKGMCVIKTTPNTKIKITQTKHSFLFSCAINPFFDKRDKEYLLKFKELFNSATIENLLKWKFFEPEEGKKKWKDADKLINWCFRNEITVKGHALAWRHPSGVPKWLAGKSYQHIKKLQIQRIKDILKRYRGKISFYEVVNEPTRALWFEECIPNFTEDCMKAAAKADPDAKLIFNGNKLFLNDGGKKIFKNFLQRMIMKGLKFDGLGIQVHRPLTRRVPNKEMWDMIEYFSTLGKKIHITEFMIQDMNPKEQAKYYRELYTICFGNPKVYEINTWGLSDDRNAVSGSGLLDKNLKEKPVYKELKKLIHKDWKTNLHGKTDNKGLFTFRGFYGDYAAEATGRKFNFKLERNNQKITL